MVSSSTISKLIGMLDLIEGQDWNRLEYIAQTEPKTYQFLSKSITLCDEFNGMTLLHACVRFHPPIKVLDLMIKLYPQALSVEDCLGRTPLHVAAGSRASPWIMKVLTVNYPQACDIQDEDGRTPLHFSCDAACELFEDDDCVSRGPPSLDTIRVLLSGSLGAVTVEDFDERNAVEYAIMSDARIDVIKLLQKASQMVMRQMEVKSSSRTSFSMSSMARVRVLHC